MEKENIQLINWFFHICSFNSCLDYGEAWMGKVVSKNKAWNKYYVDNYNPDICLDSCGYPAQCISFMKKHTKLFYRAIARIRAIGEKNGAVYLDRIRTKFHVDYIRAAGLKEELVKADVLRKWDMVDLKNKSRGNGNIIWKNLSKFRIPREITKMEKARVEEERMKGQLSS